MATLTKNVSKYDDIDKRLIINKYSLIYGGSWRLEGDTLIGEVSEESAAQARKDGRFV